MTDLPRSSRRVHDALVALGLPADIHRLTDSTRTAPEAAAAVGCELGAIVKSLVFRGTASGKPLLAEPIGRADAAFVRQVTGYAIGGIPPVGHPRAIVTVFDEDLHRFETVWAAAGHPHAVFPIAPADLAKAAGARVLRLAEAA